MRLSARRIEALIILKAQVWLELRAGKKITEAYINGGDKERVYGISESTGQVTVNPVHHVMDTLVHELIHRLHPKWGEKRVVREAYLIVATMSDLEVRRWHRQYERVRRIQKRAIQVDDDD
jgi:hypothetical protein